MNEAYIPVLVALVAGPVAALVAARYTRPKMRADASETLARISLSLVEPQKQRITELELKVARLEEHIERLEKENAALHVWAQHLVGQVVEGGMDPIPFDSSFLRRDGDD